MMVSGRWSVVDGKSQMATRQLVFRYGQEDKKK